MKRTATRIPRHYDYIPAHISVTMNFVDDMQPSDWVSEFEAEMLSGDRPAIDAGHLLFRDAPEITPRVAPTDVLCPACASLLAILQDGRRLSVPASGDSTTGVWIGFPQAAHIELSCKCGRTFHTTGRAVARHLREGLPLLA